MSKVTPSFYERYLFQENSGLSDFQKNMVYSEVKETILLGGRASGKTMALVHSILLNMTFPNTYIVVAASEMKDIKDIFSMFKGLLDKYQLTNYLFKDVKAPCHKIVFQNKSSIVGIKLNDVSMCGREFDILYLENAQRISFDTYKSTALPVIHCCPDYKLYITGTFDGTTVNNNVLSHYVIKAIEETK